MNASVQDSQEKDTMTTASRAGTQCPEKTVQVQRRAAVAWDMLPKAALERGSRSWKWLQCVDPQDDLSGELNPNPKSLLSFRSSMYWLKKKSMFCLVSKGVLCLVSGGGQCAG